MSCIIDGKSVPPEAPIGGKARALARLSSEGFPIPPWIALTSEAFYESLRPEQLAAWRNARSPQDIKAILDDFQLAPHIRAALEKALTVLCPQGELLAIRSSALDEEGNRHSFAGQLDSFLFVPPAEAPDKLYQVWRSGFTAHVLAYRQTHKLPLLTPPPAVLIQHMVKADVSGVAFGADPVNGDTRLAVVSAIYGLGTALVSGEYDADTFYTDLNDEILSCQIAHKHQAYKYQSGCPGHITAVEIPEDYADKACLSDQEVRLIARMARHSGKIFGRPQDIEWSISDNRLYLLQSRPITSTVAHGNSPTTASWDNTDLVENWGGVTTPLTFSFAKRFYAACTRQFCRYLHVPEGKLNQAKPAFEGLIGVIHGRLYVNTYHQTTLWSLIPGFTRARPMMERLLSNPFYPPAEEHPVKNRRLVSTTANALFRIQVVGRLIFYHLQLNGAMGGYFKRMDAALDMRLPPLKEWPIERLAGLYTHLEKLVMTRWTFPVLNDFLYTLCYAQLGHWCKAWCKDEEGILANTLLSSEPDSPHTEMIRRLQELTDLARQTPRLMKSLCENSVESIDHQMDKEPTFRSAYEAFLLTYGSACLEDLKLETNNIAEDPLVLLRVIGFRARHQEQPTAKSLALESAASQVKRIQEAHESVAEALQKSPFRRFLFYRLLDLTRQRMLDRENARIRLVRIIGYLRRVFLAMGYQFQQQGFLKDSRDIFFLEIHEILGALHGTTYESDLKGLVALRKKAYQDNLPLPDPGNPVRTRGMVHRTVLTPCHEIAPPPAPQNANQRQGTGCCPGVVRGPVYFVSDPHQCMLQGNEILIAEKADPGLMLLLSAAAGLVMQKGNQLSHLAIVSREIGLPTVLSIPDLKLWLQPGDWVEVNGQTGRVRKM